VGSSKNWPDAELLEHFQPADKVVTKYYRDLPAIMAEYHVPEGRIRPDACTSDDLPFLFYRTTAASAIERLEALGYTLPAVSAACEEYIQLELELITRRNQEHPPLYIDDISIRHEQLKVDCWREALRHLVSHGRSRTATAP